MKPFIDSVRNQLGASLVIGAISLLGSGIGVWVNVRSISAQTVQNTKEIADAKRAKEDLARQVETDKTELTKHVVDLRITTATLVTVVQQLTGEIQDLRQDIREKK